MGTFTPELTFGSYSYGTMSESPGILYKTIQIGDQPSLNFDFTAGVLDSKITFTRASSGTYFNSSGVLTTASANTARFSYDPATFMAQGLLIEEQRTNLLLRSEEFDNAAWILQRSTITVNAATSPDGTLDADRLVDDTATGTHRVFQSAAKAASAITYTSSVYLKADTLGFAALRLAGTAETAYTSVGINLNTGELSALSTLGFTSASATVTNAGNGWWRVALTGISDTTTSISLLIGVATSLTASSSYTGTGSGSIYLWGAQLEAGAFATSYIPTGASQVTRTADQASIVAPNFASWYNQSEGTFVVEVDTAKPPSLNATVLAIDASDGGISNRHYLGFVTGLAEGRTAVGGVTQVSLTQAYTANATEKLAYAYKANDFALARNGSLAGTDASGSLPTIDRMFIGNAAGSAAFLDGHIRSVKYFPTRLSNAQLQALSA